MSESRDDDKDLPQGTRRKLLKASALTLAGAGLYGVAPFYGPWKHNHAWAQSGAEEAAGDRPDDGRERPVRRLAAATSGSAR